MVIRQSQERRREFDEFLSAFLKRADIEDTYAKGLEGLSKQVEKYAQANTYRISIVQIISANICGF